ncbi:MAG: ClpXP protease specificity-enhancing factor SspB [Enhygromyxa sp.]
MVHPVQSVVESLYAAGRCPRLHVNATCEGVVCPDFIREQWQERLIIDLDATYPLDLSFSEAGIGADLSFGGYVTRCTFPWEAIYVVADRATGRGIVLDQNMPEAVRRSRGTPTTGPLPTGGDLREVFELKDGRVGPGRRNRRKPVAKQAASGVSQPAAEAKSERELEVQRRRAAFKVIDGGS